MTDLHDVLRTHVDKGSLPGAVGLIACGDRLEVAAVGSVAVDGVPMARDAAQGNAGMTTAVANSGC